MSLESEIPGTYVGRKAQLITKVYTEEVVSAAAFLPSAETMTTITQMTTLTNKRSKQSPRNAIGGVLAIKRN